VLFFDKLIKLIHPVMPFITEEIWHAMDERHPGETIMYQSTPVGGPFDQKVLDNFKASQEVVNNIRNIRQQKGIAFKDSLDLYIDSADMLKEFEPVIAKLANVKISRGVAEGTAVSFVSGNVKMSVPLGGYVNVDEERARLEKELEYQQNFLATVQKKLSNEKFVAHAPEAVVAVERKKEADSLARIKALEESLKAL